MSFIVKRIIALILVTLLTGAMLAGCGKQAQNNTSSTAASSSTTEASTTAPAEKTTLTVALMCSDWVDAAQKIMDTFSEKNPNIEVDFAQIPTATNAEYLQPKAAANSLPDFMSIDGNSFGAQLAENGMLADLKDTDSAKNTLDGLKLVYTSKSGKLFGIAGGYSTAVIYYNKQLYAQAGITQEPQNWDEFLATCEKLKSKNITPLVVACADGTIGNTFWSFGFANDVVRKNPNAVSEMLAGTLNLNTPEYANMFTRLKTLYDKGYLIKGVTSLQYSQANDSFMQGKAAMSFSGMWLAGTMLKSSFGTGMMMPPWNEKDQKVVPVVGAETGFGVAEGKNKDAALKMLNYFTEGDGYYIYQNKKGNVPFQKSVDESRIQMDPVVADYTKKLATYTTFGAFYFEILPLSLQAPLPQYFQRVLTEELTPEQAAAAMDEEYKAAFKK